MFIILITTLILLLTVLVVIYLFWRRLEKGLPAAPPVVIPRHRHGEEAGLPPLGGRADPWAGDAKGSEERRDQLVVESLLFASSRPLSVDRAAQVLGRSEDYVRKALVTLRNEYRSAGRSFMIDEVGGGFKMLCRGEYGKYISEYYKIRVKTALSRQALETLAVIAYKQPVTRSEIESIRGVNVDAVVAGLLERNLIRGRGRREGVGRPLLLGTGDYFLEYFGLKGLDDLPTLEDIEPLEEIKRGANFLNEYEKRLQKTGFEEKDGELPFDGEGEAKPETASRRNGEPAKPDSEEASSRGVPEFTRHSLGDGGRAPLGRSPSKALGKQKEQAGKKAKQQRGGKKEK